MFVDSDACEAAGLKEEIIARIARRLSSAGMSARHLGVKVFGGSGSGTLRIEHNGKPLILAELDGNFDGGDGAERTIDGLQYGEKE